ncbi:hypothetical protein CMI37_04030 [Candidatus Pacearchaeota archaeon]|nr:hypothetical protein [Candidatus Pacearchaeota archaeon]|tara:strand:+ start:60 stop:542 length:483 start_codon:yes stop_codon:yes gene_type:complete
MSDELKDLLSAELDEILAKAAADEAADNDDDEDDEDKIPEVWFIFDGVGTYLGYVSENPPEKDPDQHHILITGRENPYLDELVWSLQGLGENIYELPEHLDGEPGSYVIAPVDSEEAFMVLNEMGFMATRATKQDFDELLREMDKLQTIKGGESKRYSRS